MVASINENNQRGQPLKREETETLKGPPWSLRSSEKLTSLTDRVAAITAFGYDSRALTTSITDPLQNVTTLTYDVNGSATRCRLVECAQVLPGVPGMFLPVSTRGCLPRAVWLVRSPADNVPNRV